MTQLLWFEVILKAGIGLMLAVAPLSVLTMAGLPRPSNGFWPRLLGATVIAIAAGVWIGLAIPTARGAIGPAGLIAINFAAAAALIGPLVMGAAAPTRRGRFIIAVNAILLLVLGFLEIAHV